MQPENRKLAQQPIFRTEVPKLWSVHRFLSCVSMPGKKYRAHSSSHLGVGPYRNCEKAPQLLEESVPGHSGATSIT